METECNVTLGRLVKHYQHWLSEEPKWRQRVGLAVLLHTNIHALSMQSVLR